MFSRNSTDSGLESLLHRPRPTPWQKFQRDLWVFLARTIYEWRHTIPAQPLTDSVSVVCVSDTHNSQPEIPPGDILIHAGDLTQSGSFEELQAALDWLRSQPHPHKLVIAGNHDLLLDASLDSTATGKGAIAAAQREQLDWGDITYLENTTTRSHAQTAAGCASTAAPSRLATGTGRFSIHAQSLRGHGRGLFQTTSTYSSHTAHRGLTLTPSASAALPCSRRCGGSGLGFMCLDTSMRATGTSGWGLMPCRRLMSGRWLRVVVCGVCCACWEGTCEL